MFSLGIRLVIGDLASTLGPDRLILAYFEDIFIPSNESNALQDVQASFVSRKPFIHSTCRRATLSHPKVQGKAAYSSLAAALEICREPYLPNWSTCLTSMRCRYFDNVYSRTVDITQLPALR
jgi:hypothetical protein